MSLRSLVLIPCACTAAWAGLVTVHVVDRTDVLDGKSFGSRGAYERIVARAWFAVDPALAQNQAIADIARAPRNERGLVEFSADVFVLKPRDPTRGNGTALFEVSNRGGKGLLRQFNYATGGALDPGTPEDFGDGFLMERGYTLVWLGWQFDVPDRQEMLKLYAPVVKGVTGLVHSDFMASTPVPSFAVSSRDHKPYPALGPDSPAHTLTVRRFTDGDREAIPRNRWRFSDPATVTVAGGIRAGHVYEVIYESTDPAVAGLGAAAIRDFFSFLKYGGGDAVALLGDQRRFIRRAIAYGVSQSGRYLRQFLYDGFNADEKNRKVFDGIWPHVAGAARGSFNHRFAQPSRSGPYNLTDIFPFRDLTDRDPVTGWEDGLLARTARAGVVPKIFHTNSSNEYWGRSASLMHTTIDGASDAAPAPEARIYQFASTQHGAGSWPPRRGGTSLYEVNPNDYRPLMRALLDAMNDWIANGKEPPPSRHPGTDRLAPLETLRFPAIPGLQRPVHVRRAMRLDYGPEWKTTGVLSKLPPEKKGEPYPVRLPVMDADGNEVAGIRLPVVTVPLGTTFGWNMLDPKLARLEEMLGLEGTWIPFARTRKQREAAKDPRPSIEERYAGRKDYLDRVRAAAAELVKDRLMLEADLARVVAEAERRWDDLTGAPRQSGL